MQYSKLSQAIRTGNLQLYEEVLANYERVLINRNLYVGGMMMCLGRSLL